LGKYNSVESWASRLGYIVEKTEVGYVWHAFDEQTQHVCDTAAKVVDEILVRIRGEYEGVE
jgi:hypothetical protein